MKPIEVTGKTVDEAVQAGLSSLGLGKEQVEIEVIDEGSRGFLGLVGMRHARVRMGPLHADPTPTGDADAGRGSSEPRPTVVPRVPSEDSADSIRGRRSSVPGRAAGTGKMGADVGVSENDGLSRGARFLEGLVSVMGLDADVYEREADEVTMLEIEGKSLGVLIGRHGETLDSVQYLVNLAAGRAARAAGDEQRVRYVVDVAGYRKQREETLTEMAIEAAGKVIRDQRNQVLEPMSALERRIVHMALKDAEGVVTHSEGREPYRRIVISPGE
ncbi:MAG TPA: hypothetical protein DCL63_11125 [Firmicutes bacterium]|jgi:spoIIIJ-associated protein|nr:hypothetical protein [Bacillota bacterium]HBK59852.1 hypothetical protein [Bacillota bacterium]